jgi:hypothetical protein
MRACYAFLQPARDLPRHTGETLRYLVDVDGLSVGTIDFKIEKQGTYEGRSVTEYRCLFELDALLSSFVPVRGQAASLVPSDSTWPLKVMNRYQRRADHYEEDAIYSPDGWSLNSKRSKNGLTKTRARRFASPAIDFVTGFYALRSMPRDMQGCTVLFANQKAYTVWIEPSGKEKIKTPVGLRPADKYHVQLASELGKKPLEAWLWLSRELERLPYRAEIHGKHRLDIRIHWYERGASSTRKGR